MLPIIYIYIIVDRYRGGGGVRDAWGTWYRGGGVRDAWGQRGYFRPLTGGGRRSPAVACWASDHWVASSNPLRGKFRH